MFLITACYVFTGILMVCITLCVGTLLPSAVRFAVSYDGSYVLASCAPICTATAVLLHVFAEVRFSSTSSVSYAFLPILLLPYALLHRRPLHRCNVVDGFAAGV